LPHLKPAFQNIHISKLPPVILPSFHLPAFLPSILNQNHLPKYSVRYEFSLSA
jgi:hypothetical protein